MNPFMLLAILIGAGFPVVYSRLAPHAGKSEPAAPDGRGLAEAARQEGAQSGDGSLLASLLERDLPGLENAWQHLADGGAGPAYPQSGGGFTSGGGGGGGGGGGDSPVSDPGFALVPAPATYTPPDEAMPIPNTPGFFQGGTAGTIVPEPYSPPPSGGDSSAPNTPGYYGAPSNAAPAAPVFAPSPGGGLYQKAV